ncbi:glycine zipper 2TM domain-containing protein [Stenotrophomonas sp. MYb238]|uniref:glycine zipper 2TM domain-containing protein n=1 Tax=Stenotrophomonas sp. MYb238 TaxID=2040281 RepID=UPI001291014F|nr:glycine zipper 2TM domain-containing protein [Stenotrophomonas sp. MYb238]MQP75696.1 glycine zipper 2TM domain-containing protein [Stenotrophomonas sp. MYb238]
MSRSLPLAGVLVLGCLLALPATAQRYDDGRYRPQPAAGDWRRDDGRYYGDNGPVYDYARVVRVDPVIVGDGGRQGQCYERNDGDYVYGADGYRQDRRDVRDYGDDRYEGGYRQGNEGARQVATVIGGLAGAIIGSRIGGGDGRYLGTAIGTVAGGAAGRAIYDANNRPVYRRADVRVCEPARDGYGYESERVDGYDVTYEYAGREYHTHRDYHPGERIRVRVDVSAD